MLTLCRMITWVVFLRMFCNFISSLPVKRGGSLSFLTIFTFAVPELFDLIWRKIGFYHISYDNLSSVSQNVLKIYQQLIGEEWRISFIFDDFHFCCSRVIGFDMTENRIVTLCRMIAWVVFLRMFWNFISSLPVKRGGSPIFVTIFTFAVPELLDLLWRK
jgi:hypothetical protein